MSIMSDSFWHDAFQNGALIIGAISGLVAAIRSSRAANLGEKNSKSIEAGNEIATEASAKVDVANAKVDVANAKVNDFHESFTSKIETMSESTRREAADTLRTVLNSARADIERDVAKEIADMRHEIVRLQDQLVRSQPTVPVVVTATAVPSSGEKGHQAGSS